MRILFVGGGTLGPVTPLLAVAKKLKKLEPHWSFVWIGTPNGPEKKLVEALDILFKSLPIVKWPRYPSWRWLTFPFAWFTVQHLAQTLIRELKPDAIVTVGGFTAVPVIYAASKKHLPCFTHQLDLVPGLANKKIASLCASVTTSFEYERAPFGDRVTDEQIPTPTLFSSSHLPSRRVALHHFGLSEDKPITLIFGGGTGAQALNEMVDRTRSNWLKFTQVIHGTGIGKGRSRVTGDRLQAGYVGREFFNDDMALAYAAADLIVCRGGMGTLSELAALKKPMIIVPMPKSHQEFNARAFEERGAAIVIRQDSKKFDAELLAAAKLLIHDEKTRREMGERAHQFLPTDDGSAFAERIIEKLKKLKDS
ncbi:MAG: UDP-N-acetylglucosamine--N-acetylmuramyl-(pentapeptide) pyrophosphoryl-undecaprenol N-acetylglucosamine transferase [Candidatus Uhrbacteria bacterium]|nr:UDP-N-acetylglucosamine--N-acetylmuramyl-(pentapeptide) pyrophosphoryl-undecaprenol N-acetylglucosamine transferase [Candidatus Uhrbacteria bacterium]